MALHHNRNPHHPLNHQILTILQGVLHQSHPAICLYKQALELTIAMPPD
jgi:hypothetical protein